MDTSILLTTNVLLSSAAAVVMLITFLTRKTYPGFAFWLAGVLFLATGAAMLVPDVLPQTWIVRVVRNGMLIAGYMSILRGMLIFRGYQIGYWPELLLAISFLSVFGFYSQESHDIGIRIIIYCSFAALLALATVIVTLGRRPPHFGSNDVLLAIWMSIFALLQVIRIAVEASATADTTAFEAAQGFGSFYALAQVLTVQLLVLTLISINAQRIEHELREREESLSFVLEGGQLGTWDWNIVTGEVKRNDYWAEMLGFTREEVDKATTDSWLALIHPEDRERAWQSINDLLAGTAELHELEYRMRTITGDYRWILDRARIVSRDAAGHPLRMSGTHEDITERKNAEARLGRLATTDSLTGTWNRRHLEHMAEVEIGRAQRLRTPLSMLLFDIDHFKQINDVHGHRMGDQVLLEVTRRVSARLRVTDLLARWGGDEFVVLLPHTNSQAAHLLAESILARIEERFPDIGKVTSTAGVAEYHPDETFDDWLRRADEALYIAKAAGRGTIHVSEARRD